MTAMTNRLFLNKQIRNTRVARPVSARVFAWLAVIAIAGSLVTTGFVMSARRHFEAVTLGYESERLRQEAAALELKLRKLEYERARASTPLELERRARSLGLERPTFKTRKPIPRAGDED